jgi:hypothetical protein
VRSFFPQPLQHLLLFVLLMITNLIRAKWNLNVILICISFMVKDAKHVFMCLLVIWTSFENCLFSSFAHSFSGSLTPWVVSFFELPVYFAYSSLVRCMTGKDFSPFLWLLCCAWGSILILDTVPKEQRYTPSTGVLHWKHTKSRSWPLQQAARDSMRTADTCLSLPGISQLLESS